MRTPPHWLHWLFRLSSLVLPFLLAVASTAAAAAPGSTPTPNGKPLILTSFLPIHSLTLAIAGESADVQNWLPQGVDPHDFQFSPRDLRRLKSASLLIVGGLGLEGWTETKLRQLSSNPALRMVEAAGDLPKSSIIFEPQAHRHDPDPNHDHDHGDKPAHQTEIPNPHFWLDPVLMTQAATRIARALQEAHPANTEAYERNTATLIASLQALHLDFTRSLANASTAFITYHGAFPYLARRYGLRLVGVVESGPSDQPSARQLSDLGRLVRAENVRVLFMDGEPPRLARQLAADLRLKLASLQTLEVGEFGPKAYENGMRRNLEVLKKALTLEAQP